VVAWGRDYVDTGSKGMSLRKIGSDDVGRANPPICGNSGIDSEVRQVTYGPKGKGYSQTSHLRCPNALYLRADDGTYHFGITSYFRKAGEERKTNKISTARVLMTIVVMPEFSR
jgi:hypothetical protein